jgi:hypothetical protein
MRNAAPKNTEAPSTGLIIGLGPIGRAVGRNRTTLWRWIRQYGFPAARLPNGDWATTMHLIESWLLERNRLDPALQASRAKQGREVDDVEPSSDAG